MDFAIDTANGLGEMTFTPAANYMNNVYLSLMIDKGSWWFNPQFGSRLYLLKRAKLTPQTAALAVDYCKEALQWMLDAGRATAVDVQAASDMGLDGATGRLLLQVSVTQANGQVITFNTFVPVA